VHGANRLGTNSLVDLIVFGRRAGIHIADYVKQADLHTIPAQKEKEWNNKVNTLRSGKGERSGEYFTRMQQVMMANIGVYRTGSSMAKAVEEIKALCHDYSRVRVQDTSINFNTQILSILELKNLLDLSLHTSVAALNRKESRGAHSREDYPERDDTHWLKHTLSLYRDNEISIEYKEVDLSRWEAKPRTY
jgi:succinate dehydrogenase / fumarate reductase flavoprotein subunit